jgi:hypothetical protein
MSIGDSIRVNVAAFTASRRRSHEAISCDVLKAEPGRLLIQTRWPCRVFTMWVGDEWVEEDRDGLADSVSK